MNTMTAKLVAAGVSVPSLKYRIWNWLRDHPEKTIEEIVKALGMAYNPYQAMLEMERGGVIKVFSDRTRGSGHFGQSYKIKRFSVVNKLEYVNTPASSLKPKAKEAKVAVFHREATVTTIHNEAAPRVAPAAEQTVVFDPAGVVKNLTFWQTLQVFNYLKGVLA